MELRDLLVKSKELAIGWLGEPITFSYTPRNFDEALNAEIQQAGKLKDDDPRKLRINARILARLVTDWDITDEGVPVSIVPEVIEKLPMPLIGRIVTAMMADMTSDDMDPKSWSAGSPNGSSPAAASAGLRNGTGTFEPAGISG